MKHILTKTVLLYQITTCLSGLFVGNCKTPDPLHNAGRCRPISSCPPMTSLLKSLESVVEIDRTLKKYVCKNKQTYDTWICCPFRPIKIINELTEVEPDMTDHTQHKNAHLLLGKCGAKTRNFPWVAAIVFKNGESTQYLCQGSLINNRYVLTAAHCTHDRKRKIIGVRLGLVAPKSNHRYMTEYKNIAVSHIIAHQGYDLNTYRNDIALLRLKTFVSREKFEPICLPITIHEKKNIVSTYSVFSWVNLPSQTKDKILHRLRIAAQNNIVCSYANPHANELASSQLCAGGKTQQYVCYGDSGSSLFSEYFQNGSSRYLQNGILSFGPRTCSLPNFPSTYTKVSSYIDWILDNINP